MNFKIKIKRELKHITKELWFEDTVQQAVNNCIRQYREKNLYVDHLSIPAIKNKAGLVVNKLFREMEKI